MSGVTDEFSNYLGIDIQDASANDKTQILLSSFLYVLNFHFLNLRFARVLTCVYCFCSIYY